MLRPGRIGAGTSYLMSARAVGSLLWVITEDDPWCFLLGPGPDGYDPFQDACEKVARMVTAWNKNPDSDGWKSLLGRSHSTIEPVIFEPARRAATDCPAYRQVLRGHHRCAANDLPPWEKFEDYPGDPGVATCDRCNWPQR